MQYRDIVVKVNGRFINLERVVSIDISDTVITFKHSQTAGDSITYTKADTLTANSFDALKAYLDTNLNYHFTVGA